MERDVQGETFLVLNHAEVPPQHLITVSSKTGNWLNLIPTCSRFVLSDKVPFALVDSIEYQKMVKYQKSKAYWQRKASLFSWIVNRDCACLRIILLPNAHAM